MNANSVALFLHIVGALGFFMALGFEWTGLRQVRSATMPEQVRGAMGILKSAAKLGFLFMLMLVITGIYMVLTDVGWVPWILVVLGALVLVIALSVAITRPRMAALGQALAAQRGANSSSFRDLVNHPVLWMSIQTRIALALGIVFLKIAQPGLGGSLLVIGVSIVLGLVSALAMSRTVNAHEGAAS